MQFGLDLQYPGLGLVEVGPRCVGVHRRPPGIPATALRARCAPFAMWPAFPSSDYYGPSAPSPGHQQTARLPVPALAGRKVGRPDDGSHVHHEPVDGGGAQLFPCSLATATPQTFTVATGPSFQSRPGVARLASRRSRTAIPAHIHQIWSWRTSLRGFHRWFLHRTPSRLACRTRPVWQSQAVPASSGLLHPPLRLRIRLPPASPGRCDGPVAEPFHLRPVSWRLVAHGEVGADLDEAGTELGVEDIEVVDAYPAVLLQEVEAHDARDA